MWPYVTARALYPEATEFHYIGHSNGTCLLAASLASCRAVCFDNVVFAGSVVRPDFPWQRLMRPDRGKPQVRRILNYVATGDAVVASVPSALQLWRWFDLGGAGHRGFAKQPDLENIEWVPGGHDAALREQHWDEIADFTFGGRFPAERLPSGKGVSGLADARRSEPQDVRVAALGRFAAPLLTAVSALVAVALYYTLHGLYSLGTAFGSVGLLAIFWAISRVLSRV